MVQCHVVDSMAQALWALYESQKIEGLAPAMRQTLFKLEKSGFRDDRWFNAMGELAQLEKNHRQSIRWFRQALKLKEKPEYRLNLGNAYYFLGDYDSAKRILEEYLALNSDDAFARLNLINCHIRAGELDRAQTLCEEGLGSQARPAPFWNALGQIAFLQTRYSEALERFNQAYQAAPDSIDALFNRCNTLFQIGAREEAIAGWELCVRKDENCEAAWQNLATAYLEMGRNAEAQRCAEAALASDPRSADNHYVLARVRLQRKELKLARESLHEALRLRPDHLPSLLGMAHVYLLEEEKETACIWAKKVIVHVPPPLPAEMLWALGLLVQTGEYDLCLQAMTRARFIGPLGRIGFFKAICLWKTGRGKEAIAELETLLTEEDELASDAFTMLGLMLQKNGADDLAMIRYRAALEKQPGAVKASLQLAALSAAQGEAGDAILVLQKALEHHPQHPDLLYNLACCQCRAGNLDDAWTSLRAALEQGFDDVACLMDDDDLKALRELKEFAPLLK